MKVTLFEFLISLKLSEPFVEYGRRYYTGKVCMNSGICGL